MRLKARPNHVWGHQFEGTAASFNEMCRCFGGGFRARFDAELEIIYFRTGKQVQECYPGDWILATDLGAYFVMKDKLVKENYDRAD